MKNDSFFAGIMDSGPICVAFAFLGLSFGAISNQFHITFLQTIAMSLCIYAIPLQVILVHMIQNGGTVFGVFVMTVLINCRFSLMSTTLLPYFKNTKIGFILLSLPFLSASSFIVSHVKFNSATLPDEFSHFWYYIGLAGLGFFVSCVFILLGFFVTGVSHSDTLTGLLTMILPVHFMTLTAMRWPKFRFIAATFLGGFLTFLTQAIYNQPAVLMLVPILIGLIFTWSDQYEK